MATVIKRVCINPRIYAYIKAIQEAENVDTEYEKSFSRVLNYLVVLGIKKYCDLFKIPREFYDTSFFDFDKRMGFHDYKVDTNLLALRREKLKKKLVELGRSFFENDF